MAFVKDVEIDLTEKNVDLLNGKSYAVALKNAILEESPNNEAFVIGLFGEWGSGKSSIIRTAESLIKQNKGKKIKFITYDAWKYVKDSFRRMFLLQVQQSLGFNRAPLMERFYSNKSEEVEVKTSLNKIRFRWTLTTLLFIAFVVSFFPLFGFVVPNYITSLFGATAGITLIFNLFASWLDNLKVSSQTPLMFAAEQFEECFNEMIDYALNKKNALEVVLHWITRDERETNIDKLVIVIDNIDRCDSKTTYELLSNLKSFLLKNKNLVFVIPTDDKSLCKHLISSFDCSHTAAEEFLRKVFNVEIRIKPLEEIELFDFADKINKKYKLDFSADAVNIIANEFATNPRRIIQFFNNVCTELDIIENNLTKSELKKIHDIVCKLLIIREEWPDYYKLILNDSRLLNAERFEDKEKLYEKKSHDLKMLNKFLQKTHAFRFIGDDGLLEKVISNSSVFSNLPVDVRSAVKDLKKDKLSEFIEENEHNSNLLINYIIEELKKNLLRKTWQTGVPNLFKAILLVNSIKPIINAMNSRIERELKGNIAEFIGNIGDSKNEYLTLLVSYLNELNNQNKKYFIEGLLSSYLNKNILNNEEEEPSDYDISLFEKLIVGIKDKSIFADYKELFANWYRLANTTISSIKLSGLKYFISDAVINEIITHLGKDDSDYMEDFTYIATQHDLSEGNFNKFFEKINQLYPAYTANNGEVVLAGIEKVIPVLKTMNSKSNQTALQTYVNGIFQEIRVNINHYQYRTGSLIADNLTSDDRKIMVINFLAYLYKATNNNIDTIVYFEKLIAVYPNMRANVMSALQESISGFDKINTAALKKLIFGQGIFTESYVYWMKRFTTLIWLKDKTNVVSDDELAKEIKLIVQGIGNIDDRSEIDRLNELLEFILDNRKKISTTATIIEALENANKDTVIRLTDNMRTLALSKICETISDYSDNRDILENIAQYGDKENIQKLMVFILSEAPKSDKKESMISLYRMIAPEKITKSHKEKMKPYLTELEEETSAAE
ncbi:MAG: KAP family NTPase [Lactobacillaceae bacterium]|jgi:hypothetical protein|nr:KAP family NTPase [Lactobacillaceae bacterium]